MLVFLALLCGSLASQPSLSCITTTGCGVHGSDIGARTNTNLETCEAECAANPNCKYFVFRTTNNYCGFKSGGTILDRPKKPTICGECLDKTGGTCGFESNAVCASQLQELETNITTVQSQLAAALSQLASLSGSFEQFKLDVIANETQLSFREEKLESDVRVLSAVVHGRGNSSVAGVDHELNESFSCDERHVSSFQRCGTQAEFLANGGVYNLQYPGKMQYVRREALQNGFQRTGFDSGMIPASVCKAISTVGRRLGEDGEEESAPAFEDEDLTSDERAFLEDHWRRLRSSDQKVARTGFVNCLQCSNFTRRADTGEMYLGGVKINFTRTSPICPKSVGRPDLFGSSSFSVNAWMCIPPVGSPAPHNWYSNIIIDWVDCFDFRVVDLVDVSIV